tara:strand:- start:1548 stop:1763 length:216 start_codon:yes stop_codon:yes gene_type:complete
MKTLRKKLNKGQIAEGVIFASTLSTARSEKWDDTTHEVFEDNPNKAEVIDRLLDTSKFEKTHFKFNIIRTI